MTEDRLGSYGDSNSIAHSSVARCQAFPLVLDGNVVSAVATPDLLP